MLARRAVISQSFDPYRGTGRIQNGVLVGRSTPGSWPALNPSAPPGFKLHCRVGPAIPSGAGYGIRVLLLFEFILTYFNYPAIRLKTEGRRRQFPRKATRYIHIGVWIMLRKHKGLIWGNFIVLGILFWAVVGNSQSDGFKDSIFPLERLKPRDSVLTLKVGDRAPDFSLPSITGLSIQLNQYFSKKNVVISFIPAAWTPVCSAQWPIYNRARDTFHKNNAMLLGIAVDNRPTLFSWTKSMCGVDESLWFPVLSDFYPHGAVAKKYGVLRSDGLSERSLFVIDKKGIIRYIDVHDINENPPIENLLKALEELND